MVSSSDNPFRGIVQPIDELARKLAAGLPEALSGLRGDLERQFRAVLQGQLARLELTSRSEFAVQTKVLERARARIDELEKRVAALEARLAGSGQTRPGAG